MTLLPEQENQIRRYILGVATPDETEQVEIDLLRGGENVEHLLLIEDELITDYALAALDERERELMEKNYFSTPERQERLMIAHEMVKQATAYDKSRTAEETWVDKALRSVRQTLKLLVAQFRPGQINQGGRMRWKIAVYAALVIGLGIGITSLWRGYRKIEGD